MTFTLIQIAGALASLHLLYVSTQVWQGRAHAKDLWLPIGVLLMVLPSALNMTDGLMLALLIAGIAAVITSRVQRLRSAGEHQDVTT